MFGGNKKKSFDNKPKSPTVKFNGFLSNRTKNKIKRIIEDWDSAIISKIRKDNKDLSWKWKYITFVTLTLPSSQIHTDKEIKRKCLNSFLVSAKRKMKVKNFLWVAEKQKNGNIHFHILFDRFVHHSKIRKEWNIAVDSLGYVKRFKKKNGHDNPNSTDIHALVNVKNIANYVGKYISKGSENTAVEGRLWSCSKELSGLTCFSCEMDSVVSKAIELGVECNELTVTMKEYVIVIIGNLKKFLFRVSSYIKKEVYSFNYENYKILYD